VKTQKRAATILVVVAAIAHLLAAATLKGAQITHWVDVYPVRSLVVWMLWNGAIAVVGGVIAVWYEMWRSRRTPPAA
jgi:hypothetical protein